MAIKNTKKQLEIERTETLMREGEARIRNISRICHDWENRLSNTTYKPPKDLRRIQGEITAYFQTRAGLKTATVQEATGATHTLRMF